MLFYSQTPQKEVKSWIKDPVLQIVCLSIFRNKIYVHNKDCLIRFRQRNENRWTRLLTLLKHSEINADFHGLISNMRMSQLYRHPIWKVCGARHVHHKYPINATNTWHISAVPSPTALTINEPWYQRFHFPQNSGFVKDFFCVEEMK